MGNGQISILRQVIEAQTSEAAASEGPPGEASSAPAPVPSSGAPEAPFSSPFALSTPEAAGPGGITSHKVSVRPRERDAPSLTAARGVPTVPAGATSAPKAGPVTVHTGHMKLLFDNAPVAMAMFDTDMRYLIANRRWLEDFKLTKVEVTGRSHYELFPSLHPGWRHVYDRALGGQVVRSDRDAVTQDGRPVVYRWEVRPWRHVDTTIGGVTISCERIYGPATAQEPAPSESAPIPSAHAAADDIWSTRLPLLALSDKGRILRVSQGLRGTVPDISNDEDPVFFWDVFGESGQLSALRRHTLLALDSVFTLGDDSASLFTYPSDEQSADPNRSQAIHWLASKLTTGLPGEDGPAALMVGLVGLSPFTSSHSPGPVGVPDTAAVADSAEWRQLTEELARLRLAHKEASDAEGLARQRETRLRAVLELTPCGLMVIDERAVPIYHNAQVPGLLGRPVPEGMPMPEILSQGARDENHRAEVIRLWSEEVWRKRHAIPLALAGGDGLLREIQLHPVPLPGGGLVLMLQDVTEPRRGEEMLRSTEAKFRTLVHENPLPVVLADRSGAVFEVNPASELLIGYTRAEMRRMPFERWLDAESLSLRAQALQAMAARGERFTDLTVRVMHRDGYTFPVSLRIALVLDAAGQPMFSIHYFSPVDRPSTMPSPSPETSVASTPPVPPPSAPASVSPLAGAPSPRPAATSYSPAPASASPYPAAPQTRPVYRIARSQLLRQEEPAGSGESSLRVRPLLTTDVHGRINSWTADAESRFGLMDAEAVGRGLHTLFRPSDATGFYSDLAELRDRSSQVPVIWKYYHHETGRQEGEFTVQPHSDGALAVTLVEFHHVPPTSRSEPPPLPSALSGSRVFVVPDQDEDDEEEDPGMADDGPQPLFFDDSELESRSPAQEAHAPGFAQAAPPATAPAAEAPVSTFPQYFTPFVAADSEAAPAAVAAPPQGEPPDSSPGNQEHAAPVATSALAPRPPALPPFHDLQRERLLLGETHHRVKNHLQIITSMLNLQMSTLHHEGARDALRSSQNRVRSIAALHQHLYQLSSGETADFQTFATGLIGHLRDCYHITEERVPLLLDLPTATVPDEWLMPLALALNEMVSNAFKHAFPEGRVGSMEVSLTWGDTTGLLTVSDDGIGLPHDFFTHGQHDESGMGLKILRVFAGQLGGEVKITSTPHHGATFELHFPSARALADGIG